MADVFIYGGLGILLIGCVYGLFVAIKGFLESKGRNVAMSFFNPSTVSPQMRRLIRIWAWLMVLGFVSLGIGLELGSK